MFNEIFLLSYKMCRNFLRQNILYFYKYILKKLFIASPQTKEKPTIKLSIKNCSWKITKILLITPFLKLSNFHLIASNSRLPEKTVPTPWFLNLPIEKITFHISYLFSFWIYDPQRHIKFIVEVTVPICKSTRHNYETKRRQERF